MAGKVVAVPGIGNVSFPDGMSDGEINSAIEQQLGQNKPKNYSSMSPQDLASEAMKNSGVSSSVSSPATAPQMNMQQMTTPQSLGDAAWKGIYAGGYAIPSMLEGVRDRPGIHASGAGDFIKKVMNVNNPLPADTGQGLPNRIAEGGGALVGGGLVGDALMESLPSASRSKQAAPPDHAAVARVVTDTVNPPPKSMAGFEKSVQAQLPEVIQGKQISSRADLGKAFAESAEKSKQNFYDTYINPIKDSSAYGGKTIGQLDARLTEINATLRGAYEKGGSAAQAALSAEAKAQLTAEGAQTRSALYQAVADKLNVPVEQVAAARAKFGQQFDVADKIQLALNKERYATNQAAKQVPALDVTAAGLANKGIQTGWQKLRGHPADRALRNALGNYDPEGPAAGVRPQVSPASTRPAPPQTQTVTLEPQVSSPAEIQSIADRMMANRLSRAKQPTLPLTRAKPRWMQE